MPKKNTKRKTPSNSSSSKKKSNKKEEYYLIHDNGDRTFVILIKNKILKVYKVLLEEKDIKKEKNILEFIDYTKDNNNKLIVKKKPVFILPKFKKIIIGYDVNPENIYIKNKNFGKGNSILVYDGKDYYCIYCDTISKLDTKNIKGKVIGYLSPIFNNDIPYPVMITNTNIYTWCGDIFEHPFPNKKKEINILNLLLKAKSPFDIPKKYHKDIIGKEHNNNKNIYRFPYICSMMDNLSYSNTKLNYEIL